jgi:hypothetical protein
MGIKREHYLVLTATNIYHPRTPELIHYAGEHFDHIKAVILAIADVPIIRLEPRIFWAARETRPGLHPFSRRVSHNLGGTVVPPNKRQQNYHPPLGGGGSFASALEPKVVSAAAQSPQLFFISLFLFPPPSFQPPPLPSPATLSFPSDDDSLLYCPDS